MSKKRPGTVEVTLPDTEFQRKLYNLRADPQFCAWVWDKDPVEAWDSCYSLKDLEWQAKRLYKVGIEERIASFLYALKHSLRNNRLRGLIDTFMDNNYDSKSIKTGGLNKKHKTDSYVLRVLITLEEMVGVFRCNGINFDRCTEVLVTEYIDFHVGKFPKKSINQEFFLEEFDTALLSSMKYEYSKTLTSGISCFPDIPTPKIG